MCVLDVATGSGAILLNAASAVGPTGRAVGIDRSQQMAVRTARTARSVALVHVQVMDAEHLGFADGTFDVVFCGFAVFFFPEYTRALAEFLRILKPDGRLVLSTWGAPDERYKWISDVLTAHAPRDAPAAPRQTRVEKGPAWDKPEGLAEVLAGAGFRNVKTTEAAFEITYRDEQEWLDVQWSHGARAWLEPLPPSALANVTADLFAHLRELQTSDGIPQRQMALFTVGQKS